MCTVHTTECFMGILIRIPHSGLQFQIFIGWSIWSWCVTSCVGAISGQSKTVISPKRIIGKWRDRFHFKLYFSEHQVFNFQRPSIWFSLRNPPIKQIACRTNLLAELCLLLFSWWKNELRYKNQTSPVGYAIPFSMSRLTFVILFRLHGRYGDRI